MYIYILLLLCLLSKLLYLTASSVPACLFFFPERLLLCVYCLVRLFACSLVRLFACSLSILKKREDSIFHRSISSSKLNMHLYRCSYLSRLLWLSTPLAKATQRERGGWRGARDSSHFYNVTQPRTSLNVAFTIIAERKSCRGGGAFTASRPRSPCLQYHKSKCTHTKV